MIRTIVRTDKRVVSFDIPENYVGKELEVIAFSKDEGLTEVLTKKKATFDAIASIQSVLNLTVTKRMNDRVFLDTNILVYAYSKTELEKQRVARDLVLNNNSFISSQVLQELTNTLTR